MLPTFVFGWPTGEEQGDYMAVDLGGTNLRVCHVVLKGEGKFEMTQTKFRLTDEQKQEDAQTLFDWCASCLKTFLTDHYAPEGSDGPLLEEEVALGWTFSYPTKQERIVSRECPKLLRMLLTQAQQDHGVLVRWTKGFGNPGAEGNDCAAMFRKALEKENVPIKMTSMINDTTGTLIASNCGSPRASSWTRRNAD